MFTAVIHNKRHAELRLYNAELNDLVLNTIDGNQKIQ